MSNATTIQNTFRQTKGRFRRWAVYGPVGTIQPEARVLVHRNHGKPPVYRVIKSVGKPFFDDRHQTMMVYGYPYPDEACTDCGRKGDNCECHAPWEGPSEEPTPEPRQVQRPAAEMSVLDWTYADLEPDNWPDDGVY